MYSREIRVESPQEALIVEQALAMYRELRDATAQAADGAVLSVAESLAVTRGRELTRQSLQTVLQEEIETWKKRGVGPRLRLRRDGRAPWQASAVDPHGGGRGEVAARVLCVSRLPVGSAWGGCSAGGDRRANASGGADVVFGRSELVVCPGECILG